MSKAERLTFYRDHVREAGFIPQVVNEEVSFKVEGQLFRIVLDDEEHYFSILHNQFSAFRDDQVARAEEAALTTVAKVKVAKVWVSGTHATASVELFLQPGDLPALFERLVGALQYAGDIFKQEMDSRPVTR